MLGPVGPDYDPLLIDTDGSVLESARANVFVVLDDGVHTAPLDGRILPGTARARIIEQLTAAGVPVLQRRLTSDDFARASEVFVSNTLRGVVPITSVEGMGTWAPGPLAAALIEGRLSSPPAAPRTWPESARVLFIDNYDSFVYNLVQYVRELGGEADVVRNDAAASRTWSSPANATRVPRSRRARARPRTPGCRRRSSERFGPTTPVLGVCLGHQASVRRSAPRSCGLGVVHGKPSLVQPRRSRRLRGLPSPDVWAVPLARRRGDDAAAELEVTARTASGRHGRAAPSFPVEGVQMHPESILTAHGHDLLANFLR